MTSAAMQVFSMPELMKLFYEFDMTYHVLYEKCLSEVTGENRACLLLGRKLLDMYALKDMEELGYKFVKVVSCETGELETSGPGMWDDDDDTSTSSDTTVLSALRLETSWYTRNVTVLCKYQLPDSDVVKMFEAYLEDAEYDSDDQSLTCGYHTLREKPVYSEDMDE